MARRPRPVKPLNEPRQVTVRQDLRGMPVAVEFLEGLPVTMRDARSGSRGRAHSPGSGAHARWVAVQRIEDMYEIDELWWRGAEQEIQRLYFDLVLETSRKITVYHDLVRDRWYRQAD